MAEDKKKMARLAGETTDQEGQSKPEQVSATTVAGASAQEQQQSNEVRIDEACYAAHAVSITAEKAHQAHLAQARPGEILLVLDGASTMYYLH